MIGTGAGRADGEPGEIEREILADEGWAPSDFDLPGEFTASGTRRAILVRTGLDAEPSEQTFAFALPSGSYATALLREYLKGDPLAL